MSNNKSTGVLIGAGFFAQFHAEGWQRIPDADLVAVVDPAPGKARAFADRYGIPRAYESLDAVLAHEHPDFVDIATRPEEHLHCVEMAAKRGIHIICQKPMAPRWEECVAMVETCERSGVRLMIHENWRWQPWFREARRLVDAGAVGAPFQFGFQWRTGDGRGDEPYAVQPYFRQMPRLLVYETLVHLLDTLRYLNGELSSIYCRNRRVNPTIVGEDQTLICTEFGDGTLGLVDANRISGPVPAPVAMASLAIEGDQGLLRISPDGRIWLTEYGKSERPHEYAIPTAGYKGDSVRATEQHLLECLRSGQPSESDGRDYLKTVAAVLACYRSAETGEVVALD